MPRRATTQAPAGKKPALLAGVAASVLLIAVAAPACGGPRADDLRFATSAFVLKSGAFTEAARARAVDYISRSALTADATTQEQFLLCVLRIAAFADNGHDQETDSAHAWWPTARLPVRMLWFED